MTHLDSTDLDSTDLSQISTLLLDWYQVAGRQNLPWRRSDITPYHVWVSEIMLQQTQVVRVIPFYTRFIDRFPDVQTLAKASWEEFLPYYQGLGYYARGRNMLATAHHIVNQHGGGFPNDLSLLRALPGVGPYTAAAILSFGHGQPHLAFDTNHQRVWGRVLHGTKAAVVNPEKLQATLPADLPFADFNAAVMDFANLVCTNRSPRCAECPLNQLCLYAQTKGTLEPTTSPRKSAFPTSTAQTIVVLHRRHQTYYSSDPHQYRPFFLPVPIRSRAAIKEYFQRQFGLNLSVRPPHWKGFHSATPYQVINAQVLTGQPPQSEFQPSEHQKWWSVWTESAE